MPLTEFEKDLVRNDMIGTDKTYLRRLQNWLTTCMKRGHVLCIDQERLEKYTTAVQSVDIMARNESDGAHNGPKCIVCDKAWCLLCAEIDSIKKCAGAMDQSRVERTVSTGVDINSYIGDPSTDRGGHESPDSLAGLGEPWMVDGEWASGGSE